MTSLAEKKVSVLSKRLEEDPEEATYQTCELLAGEISTLDALKILWHGPQDSERISSVRAYSDQLASTLGWELATKYADSDATIRAAVTTTIDAYARVGINSTAEAVNWVGMKLMRLLTETRASAFLVHTLQSFETDQSDPDQLAQENDRLWEEIRLLERYGVVSAIAPSNFDDITQWSVMSGSDIRQSLAVSASSNLAHRQLREKLAIDHTPERFGFDEAAALFVATNGKFNTSDPHLEEMRIGENYLGKHLNIDADPEVPGGANDIFFVMLDYSGQLRTLAGVPLKDLAKKSRLDGGYEQLRSEILALYFDLVVPVYIQRALNTIDREVAEANPDMSLDERIRHIVIARRRYLRDHQAEIVRELEKAPVRASGTTTVTGHIREIASHFQASQEARRWAWEEKRKILKPFGETWVHTHDRPSRNKEKVKKIIPVSGKYATKLASRK